MIARAILAFALALVLTACQQEPDRQWPAPSPALWHVTGPDGAEGWLFGTVHALPEGAQWETPALDAAFESADVLVVEIAALTNASAAATAFESQARSEGLPPLLDRFEPSQRGAVGHLLKTAGMQQEAFADTETWAVAVQLAGAARQGDPALGVDRALLDRGKPVIGLETFADQFRVFDSLPETEQADLLLAIAQEVERTAPDATLRAWLVGDLRRLERSTDAGILADPELREALMDGRNANWAPRIIGLVDSGQRPFVAVGAAHMLGPQGLPALLAARGYSVTRIQ